MGDKLNIGLVYLGLRKYGVEIAGRVGEELSLTFPETTELVDKDGQPILGDILYNRIQESLDSIGARGRVRWYIRPGVHWTKELSSQALKRCA